MNLSFQEAIFRVVAAVLHLGNVEFAKGTDSDSSEPKDERSRFHLETAAELFRYVIFYVISQHAHLNFNVWRSGWA